MCVLGKLLDVDVEGGTITIEVSPGDTRTLKIGAKDSTILSKLQKHIGKHFIFHIKGDTVRGISSTLTLKVYGLPHRRLEEVFPDIVRRRSIWDSLARFDISVESLMDFIFVILWIAILAVAFIYAMIILPLVYLLASLFTLGETWRMRHKIAIDIKTWDIPKLVSSLPKINCLGGYVGGLENYIETPNSNASLSKPFRIMDLGRISLGLSILALILAYIHKTLTSPSEAFIDYLTANLVVTIPILVLLGIGFLAMIIAGILHRIIRKKIC